ncbi:TonB-dependent receptor domain-containing protein [Psychroserpens mesophilus]|uniref:TonB-dependent receptor domain-containing protein n=1 Tax=Psychroserpens mesophilus TaxID=325473 RepID=UPI003F499451
MKFKYVLVLFLIFQSVFGQQTIIGRITDQENKPIEAAIVSIITVENNTFVKASLTKANGRFNISNISEGTYKLFITSLGFEDYNSELVTVTDSNIDLGTISLAPKTESLDKVTITAEKPMIQVLADKTVFNVQNTINATGDSGFELLRKAPGIIIDNNDNFVVEGKTGVLIYIDDRPSVLRGQDLVNYLKTIQASDIEAVEIMTQPSSRFDAEGNAGIINIKFKRDKSLGTNGSIASGLTIGDFARYNHSLSFNTRNKKTNLYGTYSNAIGKSSSFINLFRIQNNTIFDAQTESVFDNNSNNIRLGFDVYANSTSTFGIIVNGNFNKSLSVSDTRTPIILSGNNSPSQVLVAGSDTATKTSNLYTNLNYKFKDTLGHALNIDVDFGKFKNDRTNLQPNRYFNGEETQILDETINYMVTPVDIDIFTTRIDYEQPLIKGIFSIGGKYSKIKTDNQFDFFDRINGQDIINTERTNDFLYKEQIIAAYINFNKTLSKFNLQFGIRLEHTISDGLLESLQQNTNNQVKRDYTDWFPSGGITYQLNQKNSLALIYSKRIQRPNYQSLNPFEYKLDELSFRQGNPFLQPQYTDNIKLSHTYNYRLTTAISYSFIEDFFAQITEAVNGNQNFITTRNVANQKIINLGISFPSKFNDWWSYYASVNAFRSIYEATNPDFVSTSQNTLSLYVQNTFKITNTFRAEISGWYSSPTVWGGTYETESLGALNIAFQKTFLNDKLNARLSFNDILYTIPWRGTTQFGTLFIDGNGGSDSRQIRFNLTYNFGNNEIKKARSRKTSIEDEKNRI